MRAAVCAVFFFSFPSSFIPYLAIDSNFCISDLRHGDCCSAFKSHIGCSGA